MTALSPYSPPKRNSFLRYPSQNHDNNDNTIYNSPWLSCCSYFWNSFTTKKASRRVLLLSFALLFARFCCQKSNRIQNMILRTLRLLEENDDNNNRIRNKNATSFHNNDNWAQSLSLLLLKVTKRALKTLLASSLSSSNVVCNDHSNDDTHRNDRHLDTKNENNKKIEEDCVLENQRLIRTVLTYWFGQHEPKDAQKKLWMIPSSSNKLRRQVDEQIYNQFTNLLCELAEAAPEATDDAFDNDDYHNNRINSNNNNNNSNNSLRWKQWCCASDDSDESNNKLYGYQGKLAVIIVCDQMSRHIRRVHDDNTNHNEIPSQQVLDGLALRTSELFTKEHQKEIECGMIPLPMYVFALMPYRHSNQIPRLEYVQTCIEFMDNTNQEMDNLIRRFRKASNRRLAVLQDQQRRAGTATTAAAAAATTTTTTNTSGADTKTTAATTTHKQQQQQQQKSQDESDNTINSNNNNKINNDSDKNYDGILELHPFQADQSQASKHPVHIAMKAFLTSRGIQPDRSTSSTTSSDKNKTHKHDPSNRNHNINNDDSPPAPLSSSSSSTSQQTQHNTKRKAPIIVSLSGGVDSMVITATLVHLRDFCGYTNLHIVAIHIDYANRPESVQEAEYVQWYCEQHRVDFVCRRIDEVTRGLTSRDVYEKTSRNIRYGTYRQVVSSQKKQKEPKNVVHSNNNDNGDNANDSNIDDKNNNDYDSNHGINKDDDDDDDDNSSDSNISGNSRSRSSLPQQQEVEEEEEVGVMLGHHKGDLRENVLSNAHKGCGPLDLSGMCPVSQNDGVMIYRPFLSLEKSDIFQYAHRFGVPYFKDTTPHWSTRGKIRNKLFPLLEEIYGEGCMNNLSSLATESDECRLLLHKSSLGPFLNQIVSKPMGIVFDTHPWKDHGLYFWKFCLREVLHLAGLGMFSDKSVLSFLERITGNKNINNNAGKNNGKIISTATPKGTTTTNKIRPGWLQCRKDYAVYLQSNGKVFILYPESFPFHKKDQYQCTGQAVEYGIENAVMVGPWKITSEIWMPNDVNDCSQHDLLNKKAVECLDLFMEGRIQYFLKVPSFSQQEPRIVRKKHDEDEDDDEEDNKEQSGTNGTSKSINANTTETSSVFVPRPLIFVSNFTKQSRPMAWKNADEKIQSSIPLLGNTEDSDNALKDPVGIGCVHQVNGKPVENPVSLVRVTISLQQEEQNSKKLQNRRIA